MSTWTTPITWTNSVVTAAQMNAEVTAHLNYLKSCLDNVGILSDVGHQKLTPLVTGAMATRQTVQAINSSAWTAIDINGFETFDNIGFHSLSSNPSRFTIPIGWGGMYHVSVSASFAANTGTTNAAGIGINGAIPAVGRYVTTSGQAGTVNGMNWSNPVSLSDGDYIQAYMFHNAAGAVNATPDIAVSLTFLGTP